VKVTAILVMDCVLSIRLYKMFIIFCAVKFCIFCIFLYIYDLLPILLSCDKLMDPWNVCMYVCMYSLRYSYC
jgi:hypothetical protein